MNLTDHFTLESFCKSETASRLKIENSLPADLISSAKDTCQMLERIREYLSTIAGMEIPIVEISGYRCPALNTAVGSTNRNSDHIKAAAMDFIAPKFGTPLEIAKALKGNIDKLRIGQLIYEKNHGKFWVHVSRIIPARVVNRVITIDNGAVRLGIQV